MAYTDFEESPFAGPPSPSIDQRWHDLLSSISLRVSEDELQRSNQTSVALPVGGGYMAWLGVYHQLHCIVREHSPGGGNWCSHLTLERKCSGNGTIENTIIQICGKKIAHTGIYMQVNYPSP